MTVKTGQNCPKGGIWACTKCGQEHSMGINNNMPPCSKCNHTEFRLVRASN
jgi:predicted  nucleic acid-binding Zn-ribbon protein